MDDEPSAIDAGRGSAGRTAVLHALRLVALASAEVIATRTGLALDVVNAELANAAAAQLAIERTGRFAGWTLTVAGRGEAERMLRVELDATDSGSLVESMYERFLTVNGAFLEVCTSWQLRPAPQPDGTSTEGVPNDHSDVAYDAAVLDRLDELHPVVVGLTEDLATKLGRFADYRPRFEHARDRLRNNDVDWLTRPLIDSYHTVWFELHEDLLATLGRSRSEEPRATRAGNDEEQH